LRGGKVGGGEDIFADCDEEAFAASEYGAIGELEFGFMEQLSALPAQMGADEDERLVERGGAKVVDLHMPSHRKDIERTVELAHGFIHESGDDASVDITGRTFVETGELQVCCSGDLFVIDGEDEVEALRIIRAAGEAVTCALV
jgi:hypothetical protein